MSNYLLLCAILLLALSGVPGLFLDRRSAAGQWLATALACLGSAVGLASVWLALSGASAPALRWAWAVPAGEFAVAVDGLSAVFLLPVFVVFALGSVYGQGYWKQAEHADNGRRLRFFYGIAGAAMALLVVARNSILLLMGWEIMALAAFFLVTTEDDQEHVREAGWIYLVATHCGSLCLIALFALLGSATGSFALAALPPGALGPGTTLAVFVLALVGFGIKAGLMPLHVWLPGAHANAPSHVSAAMSGVLIKMGIYGLIRVLSLLPGPPALFGEVLLLVGGLTGVLGIAFAIGQRDLKRILAYSSIENMGIVVLGLGLAMLGRSLDRPDWIALGLGGALLHVLNHSLFKSLLFLSAGSVLHGAGTREIDLLGGLYRRMPRTALCFLLGAVAICGLPPLNGFVGELLIYTGLLRSASHHVSSGGDSSWLAAACAAPALALIGALSLACFVRLFGTVFLGHGRSPVSDRAHESSPLMTAPMAALALGCLAIGLAPSLVAPLLSRATQAFALPGVQVPALATLVPLGWLSALGLGLCALLGVLGLGLARRVRRGTAATAGTWGCGYAAPAATMQYTSSSLGQMLVQLFSFALLPRTSRPASKALFPHEAHFHSQVPDSVLERLVLPAFHGLASSLARLRFLQPGYLHLYIFYILATLVVLLWR